jgi:lipid-A-disaccharide synthase
VRLLIAAGEASGDRLAADLLVEVRRLRPDVEVHALAGPALRAANVQLLGRAEHATAVGLAEVVGSVPRLAALLRRLQRDVRRLRPDLVLTVDSPGLLLRLGRAARQLDVPVVHAVCPQIWASRPHRVATLHRSADLVLCLLPHEPALLGPHGVRSLFIGHPRVRARVPRPRHTPPRFALAPGSRPGEIRHHWPVLREVGRRLLARWPGAQLVVPRAPTVPASALTGLACQLVDGLDELDVDVAIAASGTLTLELASLGVPQVVIYRVNPATWLAAQRLVTTPWIALPNILAAQGVVPEVLQDLDVDRIVAHATALLGPTGDAQIERLAPVLQSLRMPEGLALAAAAIVALGGAADRS